MNTKQFYLASLLIFVLFPAFSQDMIELEAGWKVGEKKTVTSETISQITVNGTLISDEKLSATFEIAVLKSDADYVTIAYRTLPEKDVIKAEARSGGDTVMQTHEKFGEILALFDEQISQLEYEVKLRKDNGVAEEIINWESLFVEIGEMTGKLVDYMAKDESFGLDSDSLNSVLTTMMEQRRPEMEQTVLNSVTSLFQVYAYSYPKRGSTKFPVSAYEINALGAFADEELPATVTIDSKLSRDMLTAHIDMQYDKEYILNVIREESPQFNEVQASDMIIVETEDLVFDCSSSWIRTQKTTIRFELPIITVTENTTVTFR